MPRKAPTMAAMLWVRIRIKRRVSGSVTSVPVAKLPKAGGKGSAPALQPVELGALDRRLRGAAGLEQRLREQAV